jgi:hypothetical protein
MNTLVSAYKWLFNDQAHATAIGSILVAVGMAVSGKESWLAVVPVIVAALAQVKKTQP